MNMLGSRARKIFQAYSESIFVAFLIAILFRSCVLTPYHITSAVMEPQIKAGDFLLGFRVPYGWHLPWSKNKWLFTGKFSLGQLVVYEVDGDLELGRVIGLPGDKVFIEKGRVTRNGQLLEYQLDPKGYESEGQAGVKWLVHIGKLNFETTVIPPKKLLVANDNRDFVARIISEENVESEPWLIWLSLDWSGKVPHFRLARMLKRVH